MAMYYAVWTNITNPVIFLQYVNFLTNGYFGVAIVGGFFAIMFLALKQYNAEKAFASSSFSSAILSFLFYVMGMCDVQYVMIFTALAICSVFVLRNTQGSM